VQFEIRCTKIKVLIRLMKSETNFFQHTDFAPYSFLGLEVELRACPTEALAKAGIEYSAKSVCGARPEASGGARNEGSDEPVEVNATSS
jgi:hypothetical protein